MRLTSLFPAALLAAVATLSVASVAAAAPIAATGEGYKVIVGSTGHVIATYHGTTASYSNDLFLERTGDDLYIFNNHVSPVGSTFDLGSFLAGTELVFRLNVRNTGYDFFTGPDARNPDAHAHAKVQSDWQPNETLVSFEDLFVGSDDYIRWAGDGSGDYNDLSFSFTNTVAAPSAVPLPASALLLMSGLGAVAALRRRMR